MADHLRTRPLARARPIADLPGEAALARADELARHWAIALIRARPLDGIGDIPFEELAREAPSLCAQALQAVHSDVELERLTARGAPSSREASAATRRLPAICGARDAPAVVDAVEALRGVLWEALLEQLSEPSPRLVGDACDRLAYVCAVVLAAALDASAAPAVAQEQDGDVEGEQAVAGTREVPRAGLSSYRAVIVDEHAHPDAAARASERRSTSVAQAPAASGAQLSNVAEQETLAPTLEIEIRDERREQGPAAWITSIGSQLERFGRDSTPFAVLLVELVEIERLRRPELSGELLRLAADMERALTETLGAWSGSLTRERPGRCWLLAPATDRAGAEQLAQQLVLAVGASASASDRGGSLTVAIGTAVCPDDGREAAALAAHADLGLYAARSAARASFARSTAAADDSV
ncbi:MAG: hypothetical protein ABSG93_14035 [Solirubrobacteraceae bacterium]